MLAFGFKVAWFILSLSGLLSSIAAVPAFAEALNGYLIPALYCLANLVLQGMFCLGMIWRMDPIEMPLPFCTAQAAIMTVSWLFMTVITSGVAICTTRAILRPAGGGPATPLYIRSRIQWYPTCLFLVIVSVAAFVSYLVLALKFDAVRPADGLNCDATHPVWVRLLSYAGVPLLLALPSFFLTCTAAYQYYAHSPHSRHSRSFGRLHDHFTTVPLRRQSKFKLKHGYHEAKTFDPAPAPEVEVTAYPELSLIATGPSADQRSVTPSGGTIVVAEAIPSPPESLSSGRVRIAAGRAPTVARHPTHYHLPFQWHFNESRTSPDPLRESPAQSLSFSRHTPSPLVFANPSEAALGNVPYTTTTVSVTPDLTERLYEAAPWLKDEKAYLRQIEQIRGKYHHHYNANRDGIHDDDEDYDAVSGSLRWVRNSDDTAFTVKSELEFARTPQREDYDGAMRRPSPVELSTYDAALTETPIPNFTGMVWRILFFQLLSSATQIIATVSSLIDMFAQHEPPVPFGTQHVALLLATWTPIISFGVRLPWRCKVVAAR
ncbi:hypothetical protein BD309DRAFT_251766 [Dichomitus squalens]|nr:hypothetical protein BD309DRAFT_251766 [Dichomitus squalens]